MADFKDGMITDSTSGEQLMYIYDGWVTFEKIDEFLKGGDSDLSDDVKTRLTEMKAEADAASGSIE